MAWLLALSRSTPPTSSSFAEERTPPLSPPPLGGARYRRSEPHRRREPSEGATRVEGVATAWTSLLSNEAITQMVGHEAFARALVAARGGHVHDVELDEHNLVVSGRVKGTYRDDYAVRVYLASSRSGTVTAYRSQCTCPVVVDCKHAAAVLIVARHLAAAPAVERPAWEKTLDKLVAGPPPAEVEIAPLACEFGVERIPAFRGYAGRQDLRIRPARLGKGGNWVRSGIGWDDLDFVARSYVPEHRELLLQFRAAAGSSARYTLPRSAWLSLSTVGSGFWGLLDQAAVAGLALITASPLSGPVRTESRAQVHLDARRVDEGVLQLRPRVLVEDRPLRGRARWACSASPPMACSGCSPVCPAPRRSVWSGWRRCSAESCGTCSSRSAQSRFPTRTSPGSGPSSRRPCASTCRSRPPTGRSGCPTRSRPRWPSRCRSGPTTAYGWTGRSGTPPRTVPETFPLTSRRPPRSIRDPAAEQELVAGLGLPIAVLPTELAGREALRFVEHQVPELAARGVDVVLSGAVVDYRQTTAEPQIRVAATPRPRVTDWFDLQVSVHGGRRGGAVRRAVRRPGPGRGVPGPGDRGVLRPGPAGVHRAAGADRASPRRWSTGRTPSCRSTASRPACGRTWRRSAPRSTSRCSGTRPSAALAGTTAIEPVDAAGRAAGASCGRTSWTACAGSTSCGRHQLGGILADDMGLGKTLQTLALVARARRDRAGRSAVPGRRPDQRGVQLDGRGGAVRTRSPTSSR